MPESVGLEFADCLCGSTDEGTVKQTFDPIERGSWTYHCCPACSLERLSPSPTISAMSRYHPDDYTPFTDPAPQQARPDETRCVRNLLCHPRRVLGYGATFPAADGGIAPSAAPALHTILRSTRPPSPHLRVRCRHRCRPARVPQCWLGSLGLRTIRCRRSGGCRSRDHAAAM